MDLEYAGMGPQREAESAIMSRKVPPRISHVSISNNAFNGINVTLPGTFFRLQESTISGNNGRTLRYFCGSVFFQSLLSVFLFVCFCL